MTVFRFVYLKILKYNYYKYKMWIYYLLKLQINKIIIIIFLKNYYKYIDIYIINFIENGYLYKKINLIIVFFDIFSIYLNI